MIVKCSHCSIEFEKKNSEVRKSKTGKHYCSKSCSAKSNNLGRQRNPPVSRVCNNCQKEFYCATEGHKSKINCPDCTYERDIYREKTLREYHERSSVRGKHRSWVNSHVRNFARSWNKELKSCPCQKCGYDKHIEFCHIKAISDFDESTKLGEINSKHNILVLCRNCHWEFDHGMLSIEDIPKRKEH